MPGVRFGLLTRIVVALAATGLIPVAFVSYRLVDLNRDALISQVLQTHAVAARTTAERIEAFVAGWRTVGEAVAQNALFATSPRSPEAASILQDLLAARAEIGAAAIVNLRGEELLRAQRRDVAADLPAILEVPLTEPVGIRRVANRVWMVENLPLAGAGGYLRLVVDARALDESIDPEEIGQDAEIAVVDRAKHVILGRASAASFPASLLDDATSGHGTKGARRYEASDGEVALGAFGPVSGTGWAVVSVQPGRVAEAVARRLRVRALIAIAIAIALIALAALAAWGSLVRPIRSMLAAQRRLTRLPGAEGGDELRQLKSSLDVLERRVRDKAALDDLFLGRYRVLDILGEGGMGSVFRGWDPKLQREIALKTIHLGRANSGREAMLQALMKEAVTVAKLSNANIVAVFDVEDSGDAAFVAMELVDGVSLEKYLHVQERVEVSQVVPLAAAIANGLAGAHRAGIVHQDVKPANVLLGRDGTIKVTDFGIAALVTSAEKRKGVVFGTPGYIAPEAIERGVTGPEGDLFSLGVLLYHSLSGIAPFNRSSVRKTLLATLHETPEPLESFIPDIEPQVARIIARLLEKDPFARIREAGAVSRELGEIAVRRRWTWKFQMPWLERDPLLFRSTMKSEMIPTLTITGANVASGVPE